MVIGVDVGKITTMAIYKKGNVEIRQFEIGTAGLIDFFEWMRIIMSYYKTHKKENLFYVEAFNADRRKKICFYFRI